MIISVHQFCHRYETLVEERSTTTQETSTNNNIRLPAISNQNKLTKYCEKATEETPLSSAGTNSTNNLKISPSSSGSITEMDDCSCGKIKPIFLRSRFKLMFQWTNKYYPGTIAFYSLLVSILSSACAIVMLVFGYENISQAWFLLLFVTFVIISTLSLIFISFFNEDQTIVTYKVIFHNLLYLHGSRSKQPISRVDVTGTIKVCWWQPLNLLWL